MQPAPIRARARRVLDRASHARVQGFLKVAVVAGLAFAGWLVLSTLAGSFASAATSPAVPASPASAADVLDADGGPASGERTAGGRATSPSDDLLSLPARRVETITGARLPRTASATVGGLVSDVSGTRRASARARLDGLPVTRPATALIAKTGLRDRITARDALSPAAVRNALDTLFSTGQATSPGAEHGPANAQRPDEPGGKHAAMAPRSRSPLGAHTGCRTTCARPDQAPAAPQPALPPGQDNLSGSFLQTAHAPGPLASTIPSVTGAARPTGDVPALPAAAPEDDSAPADPIVVPD